jgi:hypothetical protein
MPLDVVRLRDSDLTAMETAEAFRAAVMLWCASWHQLPAASLPDDNRVLANLSGYGRVVKEFEKERDGALRGWVKCTDGRLYHPVVAEKAVEAWRGKLERLWRTECARIKKHNQRHELALALPEFDAWLEAGRPQGQALYVPEDKKPLSQGQHDDSPQLVPGEMGSKGQGERKGEGQGQGQGQLISPSLRSGETAPAKPPRAPRQPKSEIPLADYLASCKAQGLKAVPDGHHVRAWAQDAGLSDEMLQVAWLTFRDRHIPAEGDTKLPKKQKDWPATFANAVKDNWYRLWFIDGTEVKWSSQGQIQRQVYEKRLADHNTASTETQPA